MTSDQFDALIAQREDLERQHRRACDIHAEEPNGESAKACARAFIALDAVQKQIDAELIAARHR